MTGSRDEFGKIVAAAGVGAAAIVIEHLAATEITRSLPLSPEWEKRLSNVLGVSTIYSLYILIARNGDSRSAQVGKLGAIIGGCATAALTCSLAREAARLYREASTANGRLAERASEAREDGLDAWRRSLGA